MQWRAILLVAAAASGDGPEGTHGSHLQRLKAKLHGRARGRMSAVEERESSLSESLQGKGEPAPTPEPTPAPTPVDMRDLMYRVYDMVQDQFDEHSRTLEIDGSQQALRYHAAVSAMQRQTQAAFTEVIALENIIQSAMQKAKEVSDWAEQQKTNELRKIEDIQNKQFIDQEEAMTLVGSYLERFDPIMGQIRETGGELDAYNEHGKKEVELEEKQWQTDLTQLDRRAFQNSREVWKRFKKDEKNEEVSMYKKLKEMAKEEKTDAIRQDRDREELHTDFKDEETDITNALGKDGGDEDSLTSEIEKTAEKDGLADEYAKDQLDNQMADYKYTYDRDEKDLERIWNIQNKALTENQRRYTNYNQKFESSKNTLERKQWAELSSVAVKGNQEAEEAKKTLAELKQKFDTYDTTGGTSTLNQQFAQNLNSAANKLEGDTLGKLQQAISNNQGLVNETNNAMTGPLLALATKQDSSTTEQVNKLEATEVDGSGLTPGFLSSGVDAFKRELRQLKQVDSAGDAEGFGLPAQWAPKIQDAARTVTQWEDKRDQLEADVGAEKQTFEKIQMDAATFQNKAFMALSNSDQVTSAEAKATWDNLDDRIKPMEEAGGAKAVAYQVQEDAKHKAETLAKLGGMGEGGYGKLMKDTYAAREGANEQLVKSILDLQRGTAAEGTKLRHKTIGASVALNAAMASQVPNYHGKVGEETHNTEQAIRAVEELAEDGAQALIDKGGTDTLEQGIKSSSDVDKAEMAASDQIRKLGNKIHKSNIAKAVFAADIADSMTRGLATEEDKVAETEKFARELSRDTKRQEYKMKASVGSTERDAVRDLQTSYPAPSVFNKQLTTTATKYGASLAQRKDEAKTKVKDAYGHVMETGTEAFVDTAEQADQDARHTGSEASKTRRKYLAEYTNFLAKVHQLAARITGFSANQEEWHKKIQSQVGEEAALAQREMMVAASSAVEQQALVQAKFRSIQEIVDEDVAGVSGPVKSLTQRYVNDAKQETLKILQDASLDEEEKKERLKMVDKWLQDSMLSLSDVEHRMGVELVGAEEMMSNFDDEAEGRAAGLEQMMLQRDSKMGLSSDRHLLESAELTLHQLAKRGEEDVEQMSEAVEERAERKYDQHAAAAKQVNTQLKEDRRVLTQVLKDANQEVDMSMGDAKENLNEHTQAMLDSQAEVARVAAGLDQQTTNLNNQVNQLRNGVQRVLNKGTEERKELEQPIAEIMRTLVIFSMQPLLMSKAWFKHQNEQHNQFAQQFETLMESDGMKLLHKLGQADKDMMAAQEHQNNTVEWVATWDKHSDEWERQVSNAVLELAKEKGLENEMLMGQVGPFKAGIDAAAEAEADAASRRIAAAAAAENGAADATNAAQAEALDALARAKAQQDAAGNAELNNEKAHLESNREHQELATQQLAGFQNDMLAQMQKTGLKAAAAASAQGTLEQQLADDAAAAKQGLADRLRGMAAGTSFSEVGSTAESRAEAMAARVNEEVLEEHDQLAAEHARLASKVQALEAEADAKHLLD